MEQLSSDSYFDIIIIGAGASGLMSACLLASQGGRDGTDPASLDMDYISSDVDRGSSKKILVLEKENKVGRKLSATGNGRCNLTNLDMDWKKYYGDREWITTVIDEVSPQRVIRQFEKLGVLSREKDGYVYPHSNQAQTVVGALYRGMRSDNIKLKTGCRATEVICEDYYEPGVCLKEDVGPDMVIDVDGDTGEVTHIPGRFTVVTEDGTYESDKLIMACGTPAGREQGGVDDGYRFLRSLGHDVTSVYPGLTGLDAAGRFWKDVAGTRVQGSFTLYVDGMKQGTDTGEIQITKTGVSGIPVFQMCRMAAEGLDKDKRVWGEIDFVPAMSVEDLESWIGLHGIDGLVPGKWIKVLGYGQKSIKALAKTLKQFEFTITDTYGIERAQVAAGGVPVSEVSPETFESRVCPGLYVLGELVDVDGICGGYNLHLAWASAMLAVNHIISN